MEEEPSFTIAPWHEVTATLGQGGMGAVYRAHGTTLDRAMSIKTSLLEHLVRQAGEALGQATPRGR